MRFLLTNLYSIAFVAVLLKFSSKSRHLCASISDHSLHIYVGFTIRLERLRVFLLNCFACTDFQLFEMNPYIRCKQTEMLLWNEGKFCGMPILLPVSAVKNDNDASDVHYDSKSTWFYRFNKGKKHMPLCHSFNQSAKLQKKIRK